MSEAPESAASACPHCGADATLLLEGHCMGCLLRSAEEPRLPSQLGPYEIVGRLGEGGMGVVYRAREPWSGREVALKALRGGEFAKERDRLRFQADLSFLSQLQHPNIVQVHDTRGIRADVPFYTMQLVEGGSLDDDVHRSAFREPKRAAQLIATLARAVQFCHDAERPVLHRDIKPGNILIGHGHHPYLTDFGVAIHLSTPTAAYTGGRIGTLMYMAPEQATGSKLGKASDVYSLGAVLYELITGAPPLTADSELELLRRIEQEEPSAPERRVPGLSRDLSKICLAALRKRPIDRYATAAAFADDLERYLRDEPPWLPSAPTPWAQRARSWVRCHPLSSFGLAATLLLLVLMAASASWLLRSQQAELRQQARLALRFAARAQAGAVLNALRESAEDVELSARELERQLAYADALGRRATLDLSAHAVGFDAITLFSREGVSLARFPPVANLEGRRFGFRDYFRGALELGALGERRATPARAFRSEAQRRFEFALSAPLFDTRGGLRAVLLAMVSTRAAFGSIYTGRPDRREPITVVLGPRDLDRAQEATAASDDRLFVLIHPLFARGRELELPGRYSAPLVSAFGPRAAPGARLRSLPREPIVFEDYADPAWPEQASWLAAAAPVGHSGYVVLVQTRHEDALQANSALAASLLRLGLPLAVFVMGCWSAGLLTMRKRVP